MKKLFLLFALVAMATQMSFADNYLYVKRNGQFYMYYDLDSLDHAEQTKGWEWIDTETPETVYIKGGTALKYASHPSYRVKGEAVYNSAGTLVRILSFAKREEFDKKEDSDSKYTDGQRNLSTILVKQDYINNVQGIKNAGKDVVYSLTYHLGMNPQAVKEKNQRDYKLGKAIVFGNKKQAQWALLGAALGNDKWNNPRALQFINDRIAAHADEVDIVYKFERLTPTSFKIITLDADGNATHAFKVTFKAAGAFKFKTDITVTTLGGFKGTEVEWESDDDSDDNQSDNNN